MPFAVNVILNLSIDDKPERTIILTFPLIQIFFSAIQSDTKIGDIAGLILVVLINFLHNQQEFEPRTTFEYDTTVAFD